MLHGHLFGLVVGPGSSEHSGADTTAVPLTAVPRVADIVAPVVVPLRDHWREWTAACLADPAFPANDVFSQEAKVSERANG